METKNEIQKTEPGQMVPVDRDAPLMVQIIQMMQSGLKIDTDQMEKMIEISERVDANNARKAYNVAMAEFKKDPPQIFKDKFNTQYKSNYSSLGNVTLTINAELSKYGLSATWRQAQKENGWPDVTCIITHALGHSESTSMAAPPDDSGSKNPIQQIKSTISYLEQITLLSLTGLATEDMGNDGNGAGKPPPKNLPVTDEHMEVIRAVTAKLHPAKVGFILNTGRIRGILLEKCREHLKMEFVGKISAYLMDNYGDDDFYKPDDRDEFTQSLGIFPDEEETQEPHGDAYEG